MPPVVPTLLITGTVGVGKSTVAAEINDALAQLQVPNAAVDLDALTWQWPPGRDFNSDLMFDNLASLWPHYLARGVTHLVLARVLSQRAELERYGGAVPGARITVARLVCPPETREERLRRRMPVGPSLQWHLARSVELEAILERAACEDFIVSNGDRPLHDVATEVLVRAGWVTSQQAETCRLPMGRSDARE